MRKTDGFLILAVPLYVSGTAIADAPKVTVQIVRQNSLICINSLFSIS